MGDAELWALPVDELVAQVGIVKAYPLKHVASLLYTYRCTIACRHCLFSCSPSLPDIHVSHEHGLEFLRQLRQTDRVIHIAGGEAMMYYEDVLALCREANKGGFAPHFIETNASWCTTDELAYERYRAFQDAGLFGVLISADPYHQYFVPPERRLRAYQVAVEVFGRENVAAGDLTLEQLDELRRIGRDEQLLADYNARSQPRLIGRAGHSLAQFYPDRPLADLAGDPMWHGGETDASCRREFDPETMWEIHLDPYGNVQTCCGIIVGNVFEMPLQELLADGFHVHNDLVRRVYERGPFALLELAQEHGYQPAERYKQKCHLCWEVRRFLRPYYPETFGPAEIYDYLEE